jgi:hypothetical protein
VSTTIDAARATGRRERPLLMRRGTFELVLPAEDANMLLDGIDRLIDGMQKSRWDEDQPGVVAALNAHLDRLHGLQEVLLSSSSSLVGPPLKLERRIARLLRDVIADMRGYQRIDLTTGLVELRRMLD